MRLLRLLNRPCRQICRVPFAGRQTVRDLTFRYLYQPTGRRAAALAAMLAVFIFMHSVQAFMGYWLMTATGRSAWAQVAGGIYGAVNAAVVYAQAIIGIRIVAIRIRGWGCVPTPRPLRFEPEGLVGTLIGQFVFCGIFISQGGWRP